MCLMFPRAFNIVMVMVLILFCLRHAQAENDNGLVSPKKEIYDTHPNHLWNRLHRALFVRTSVDGTEYGLDQLDPLLWHLTKHLLEGPAHTNALLVLDDFLSSHGETLIRDPLKRAILERDLWAVFDWTSRGSNTQARQELLWRLAAVLRKVALTKEEINALPDNYEAAVKSHEFETDFKTNNPASAFLPPDLFTTNGPWICVGIYWDQEIAPTHVHAFGGRSSFLVFIRTPGGHQEGTNFLNLFREFPRPFIYENDRNFTNQINVVIRPGLPQFPAATTLALIRQAILVTPTGEMMPTHLTESVQIRRYNDLTSQGYADMMRRPQELQGQTRSESISDPKSLDPQTMVEFVLSRNRLFGDKAGGLRAVAPNEKEFRQFMDQGHDPFEEVLHNQTRLSRWFHPALDCAQCHGASGVHSVNSFFQTSQLTLPHVFEVDVQRQRMSAIYWKKGSFDWGLLLGLWEQH